MTEVGERGKRELERRHFSAHLRKSRERSPPLTGRRYIPHGSCEKDDRSWRPHPVRIQPKYSEVGPDWKSLIRYIPSPKDETKKDEELWPEKSSHLRTYAGSANRTANEYELYLHRQSRPYPFPVSKKLFFDDKHVRSSQSMTELDDRTKFGRRKKEDSIDKRNGIWSYSPGDKSYKTVELSTDYYKVYGTSVSPPNFGVRRIGAADTFVPLVPTDVRFDRNLKPFTVQEQERKQQSDAEDVRALETWQPAEPFLARVSVVPEQLRN